MYILGDIGNTDAKLCLVSTKNKIIKGRIVRDLVDMYQKKLNDFVGFKNLKDLKC